MRLCSYVSVNPFFCFICFAPILVLPYKEDNTHQVVIILFIYLYLDYDPFFLDGLFILLHMTFFIRKLDFWRHKRQFLCLFLWL